MKHADPKVRADALGAFQFLGLKVAPQPVADTVQDSDPTVRVNGVMTLGEIGDAATLPPLMAAAADPKADVGLRSAALWALGHMRAAPARALVERLLSDPNDSVSTAAAIAFYRIAGIRAKQFPPGYNAD